MKKVILSLLVAASAAFGFQDVETFLNSYNPDEKYFTLGDVRDSNKRVMGTASCVDGKYTVTVRVVNLNTKYIGTVSRVYDTPQLNRWCGIVNNATEVRGTDWFNNNQKPGGKEYYFKDGTYDYCYYIRKEYVRGKDWAVAQEQTCLTKPSPLAPLEEMPVLPIKGSAYTEEKAAPILKTIKDWNAIHGKLDAFWIDQGEERFRPTAEQYQEIVSGAEALGLVFDSEFNWYTNLFVGYGNKAYDVTTNGNPEYRYKRDTTLAWARDLAIKARQYDGAFGSRYYYDCRQANSGRGDMKFLGYVTRHVYSKSTGEESNTPVEMYPAVTSEGTYACNNSLKGTEISSTEFYRYSEGAAFIMAPIYIAK